ncbi:Rho termination factor [Bernardetia litoralis DSM 6794]|uniref:Rho termination factor n=1 Tax=Bernardetia litoralis (strain ATCC 23117 / DSM 6794 / NBRC 15988 / NCIMB 1366 / Fx l1 / Sio-4) TaxID=880071 RepID=I4ANH7_BERLS|nr:Rho termination factor N-terminal domain-containing protein [Bernardetia litoralis]AFM05512.1 Rho termination factor [Bernardetia litoralis DSM 6794]
MIIKSLLEIAFYSSLLVVKKVSSTIEENLPFSDKKKQKTASLKIVKTISENEKVEDNKVTQKEKRTTSKKEIDYSSKTKKELYEIAQEIDLEGRSTMNKYQLLKALKEHKK